MRKFEFKNAFEEVEINGNVYKIYFSDEQLKKYQKAFNEFFQQSQDIVKMDTKNMSGDEEDKLIEQSKVILKKVIETLLGDNTFEKIYKESGKSLINIAELITFLSEIVGERMKTVREEKMNKYIKNKGKRK